jgi:hypothetical protein
MKKVSSTSNKQKNNEINYFCWRLQSHWRKEQDPDPLIRGTDSLIRIRTKMSWIRKTVRNDKKGRDLNHTSPEILHWSVKARSPGKINQSSCCTGNYFNKGGGSRGRIQPFRLYLFLNFEDEPLMSCRLCHFQAVEVKKHVGEIYVLDFAAKLLGGPPCYHIGSLVELLIPIGPLFQLR